MLTSLRFDRPRTRTRRLRAASICECGACPACELRVSRARASGETVDDVLDADRREHARRVAESRLDEL